MTAITHNATLISEIGNRRVVDIRGKWVNWLDDQTWKPIDCSFVEVGNRFECRTGPLTITVPKRADGVSEIVSSNKWDVFNKTQINDPDYLVGVKAEGVSLVGAAMEAADTIAFPAAYPFGDLIYRLRHGRAPRCEKLIRIAAKPSGSADLRISFTLTPDRAEAILSYDRMLTIAERDDRSQIGIELKNKLTNNQTDIRDIMRENLRQRALMADRWNGQRKEQHQSFGFVGHQVAGRRGVGFKPGFAWDSSPITRRIPIVLEIEKKPNGSISLTKIVPRSFLEFATYPVFTDTTSTFYPDADTEATSVDGYVRENPAGGAAFATLIAGSGSTADDSGTGPTLRLFSKGTSSIYGPLDRVITLFDTSSIGSSSTINSGTLSIYFQSKSDNFTSTADPDACLVSSSPASNTALAASDFATVTSTAQATSIAYASITASAYNNFTLNATGLASISKSGVSKYGIKIGFDYLATSPTWQSAKSSGFVVSSSENSGTTQDPKLVVDFTASAGGGGQLVNRRLNNSLIGGKLASC